jgi:hypothetical protein
MKELTFEELYDKYSDLVIIKDQMFKRHLAGTFLGFTLRDWGTLCRRVDNLQNIIQRILEIDNICFEFNILMND